MDRYLPTIILILSLLGFLVAGYSFLHFLSVAGGDFCNVNAAFDCDVVNRGPYARAGGIPVSLIGLVGYAFLALTAALKVHKKSDKALTRILTMASLLAFLFSVYLTGIEVFVLETFCLVCLTSFLLIILLFVSCVWLWGDENAVNI